MGMIIVDSHNGLTAGRSRREKARILCEYFDAPRSERSAVLNKYGVNENHISRWRKAIVNPTVEAMSDSEKAAIVQEYQIAPEEQKKDVREKHSVTKQRLRRWKKTLNGELTEESRREPIILSPDADDEEEAQEEKRPRGRRRIYARRTIEEKEAVVQEYEIAEWGTKSEVLEKYGIPQAYISIWRKELGKPSRKRNRQGVLSDDEMLVSENQMRLEDGHLELVENDVPSAADEDDQGVEESDQTAEERLESAPAEVQDAEDDRREGLETQLLEAKDTVRRIRNFLANVVEWMDEMK